MPVLGLKEIEQNLKRFGARMNEDILVDALKASGREYAKDMRANLGDDPELARSITVRKATLRRRRRGSGEVIVAPRQGGKTQDAGWRAHFRERGTDPHRMIIATKRVLANKAGDVFGLVVNHPGHQARPFMRPAFDSAGNRAIEAFRRRMIVNVDKATARMAAGKVRLRGKR